MKKLLALMALMFSMAANALSFGEVIFSGPAFTPVAVGTFSTESGFGDNFTTGVGGTNAVFDGSLLTVYSTSLPSFSNIPPSTTEYVQNFVNSDLASFLMYTAPLAINAETSAAVQLGVWVLSGHGFTIVDNISLGNAENLAAQWLYASAGASSNSLSAFSLDNKSYTGYAYATANPVPEPSTYALLFAGLGVIVFLSRRRKMPE